MGIASVFSSKSAGKLLHTGVAFGVSILAIGVGVLISFNALILAGVGALSVLALLILRRPQLGLWLMLFLIPLELVLVRFTEDLTATKLVGVATFASTAVHLLLERDTFRLRIARSEVFLILWLLASAISLIVAPSFAEGVGALTTLIQMVILYAVIQIIANSESRLVTMITCFVVSGALVPILAFMRYSAVAQGLGDSEHYGGNSTALLLCLMVPLVYTLRELVESRHRKALLTALLFLCLVSVPLTWSRGATLALGATILYMLWINHASPKAWGLFGVVGSGAALLAPPLLQERISSVLAQESTWSGRLDAIWPSVMRIIQDHWLYGTGLRGLASYLYTYQYQLGVNTYRLGGSAHNDWLEVWVETGVLGIIGWLGFELLTFSSLRAARLRAEARHATKLLVIARGAEAAFVGLLVDSMSITNIYSKEFWVILGVMAATVSVIDRTAVDEAPISAQARLNRGDRE